MRSLTIVAACLLAAACSGGEGGNQVAAGDNAAIASGGRDSASGGAAGQGEAGAKGSLLDALAGSSDFATLGNAVKAAGLERTLSGAQPYTLFAPTEAAFRKLPPGMANGLLAPDSKRQLTVLLTGHIVPGTVTAEDLSRAVERGKGKAQLATVGGGTLTIAKQGDALVVTDAKGGQARVVTPGQAVSNGVVHGIDAVLAPQ
jgi:uncharacterized surface protein with fasciclin (FAS1) repeats